MFIFFYNFKFSSPRIRRNTKLNYKSLKSNNDFIGLMFQLNCMKLFPYILALLAVDDTDNLTKLKFSSSDSVFKVLSVHF